MRQPSPRLSVFLSCSVAVCGGALWPAHSKTRLSFHECGSIYGVMAVSINDAKSRALNDAIIGNSVLASIIAADADNETGSDQWSSRTTFADVLAEKIKAGEFEFRARIQVGAELSVAEELKRIGVGTADLESGDCDGADRSHAVIKRSAIFQNDKFIEQQLEKLTTAAIEKVFSTAFDRKTTLAYRIVQRVRLPLNVSPHSVALGYHVIARAEATLGKPGWYRFFIKFEPVDAPQPYVKHDSTNERMRKYHNSDDGLYTIAVQVDNLHYFAADRAAPLPEQRDLRLKRIPNDRDQHYKQAGAIEISINNALSKMLGGVSCEYSTMGYSIPLANKTKWCDYTAVE